MKERIKAIVTIVAAGVAFVNTILTAKGINPLPFSEDAVYEWASMAVNGILVIYAWWKNQNVTEDAQDAQAVLDVLKGKVDYTPDFEVDDEDAEEYEEDNMKG